MFENFTWPSIMKIPPQNFFLDKSQSKFLDISHYFLATPLKMLEYNFLSFHCFPEKFFIDPRDHINICKDFGNLKRFQSKKIGLQTYRHVIWKLFQSYNNWVSKWLTCIFYALYIKVLFFCLRKSWVNGGCGTTAGWKTSPYVH